MMNILRSTAAVSNSGIRRSVVDSPRLISSCSSSASRNGSPSSTAAGTASSPSASPSTAQDKKKKDFKLKRGSMSGLAIRRASLLKSSSIACSRSSSSSSRSGSGSNNASAPMSTYLDTLRSPSSDTFSAIHLYPLQFALHRSFTPAHMPLPLASGTNMYKSSSTSTSTADDLFVKRNTTSNINADAPTNPFTGMSLSEIKEFNRNSTIVEHHSSVMHALNLEGGSAAHWPEVVPPTAFTLLGYEPFDASPLDSGAKKSGSVRADEAWANVLEKMEAAMTTSSSPSVTENVELESTQQTQTQAAAEDLQSAIDEVNALLTSIDLTTPLSSSSTTLSLSPAAPTHAHATRSALSERKRTLRHLSGVSNVVFGSRSRSGLVRTRIGRWNMGANVIVGVNAQSKVYMSQENVELVDLGEIVQMDSVQRKRRKKISKHKYKKRRKATKAERKRLKQ